MNRRPLSLEHRISIGATLLGITRADYRRHVEAGEKWCNGCHDWHPRTAFGVRRTAPDGLNYACKSFVLAGVKDYQRRLREGSERRGERRRAS